MASETNLAQQIFLVRATSSPPRSLSRSASVKKATSLNENEDKNLHRVRVIFLGVTCTDHESVAGVKRVDENVPRNKHSSFTFPMFYVPLTHGNN